MTPLVQNITDLLSYLTVLSDVFVVFLFIVLITPLKKRGWGKSVKDFFGKHAVLLSFLVAGGSVVGSLFYSQVALFAPCLLCWIQRGFLYTEAVIFFIALLARKDEYQRKYGNLVRQIGIILSALSALVSVYNVYLQFGGTTAIDCGITGVNCQFVYFIEYGYVTIPTMALTAALLIILFMACRKKGEKIVG